MNRGIAVGLFVASCVWSKTSIHRGVSLLETHSSKAAKERIQSHAEMMDPWVFCREHHNSNLKVLKT